MKAFLTAVLLALGGCSISIGVGNKRAAAAPAPKTVRFTAVGVGQSPEAASRDAWEDARRKLTQMGLSDYVFVPETDHPAVFSTAFGGGYTAKQGFIAMPRSCAPGADAPATQPQG